MNKFNWWSVKKMSYRLKSSTIKMNISTLLLLQASTNAHMLKFKTSRILLAFLSILS
jgi:hypothetical protein